MTLLTILTIINVFVLGGGVFLLSTLSNLTGRILKDSQEHLALLDRHIEAHQRSAKEIREINN